MGSEEDAANRVGGRNHSAMFDTAKNTTIRDLWRRQCATFPDRPFLVFVNTDTQECVTYSYQDFDHLTEQFAALLAERGLRKGDRLCVYLDNCVEFLVALLAAPKIGVVIVPVNAASTVKEYLYIVNKTRPRLVLTRQDCYRQAGLPDFSPPAILVDDPGEGSFLRELQKSNKTVPTSEIEPLDLWEIMFTSGTTSSPKGVMLTNANAVFSGLYVNWELSMTCRDRYLTSMVVSHVNFQLSALAPVITAGATLVLQSRYSAKRFWEEARIRHATLAQGMAMIVRTMLRQPKKLEEQNHCVREMHYFLPISIGEKQEFCARFGVSLFNNYGLTESLVGVITDSPHAERRWPSIGKVGPTYQVRLVDSQGEDNPGKEGGSIEIHGTPGINLMAGYWEDPQATRRVLSEDGWLRTDDYALQDRDGWYYFLGRDSDLIKRGGENVSAAEVENVLMQCPGVQQAAVIGVPDSIRDQAIKAFVVLESGVKYSQAEIISFAQENLSYYKVPSSVEFRRELPQGKYGKVAKNKLA